VVSRPCQRGYYDVKEWFSGGVERGVGRVHKEFEKRGGRKLIRVDSFFEKPNNGSEERGITKSRRGGQYQYPFKGEEIP